MIRFDDIATSADLGRISPEEKTVQEATHSCPKIGKRGIPLKHKTVSEEQCIERLRIKAQCTISCEVVDHLREKLNDNTVRRRTKD